MFANIEKAINKAVSRTLSNVSATHNGFDFVGMFDEKPTDELGVQGVQIRLRYLSTQLATQPLEGDTITIGSDTYYVSRPLEYDNEFIVMSLFR